jgi:hypothetical protein
MESCQLPISPNKLKRIILKMFKIYLQFQQVGNWVEKKRHGYVQRKRMTFKHSSLEAFFEFSPWQRPL